MNTHKLKDLKNLQGASVFFPAPMDERQACYYDFKKEFSIELPDDYFDFLQISNGFIYKKIDIFGTRLQHLSDKNLYMEGVIEINRFHYTQLKATGIIVLGKTEVHLLCYNAHKNVFLSINRMTTDLYKTFESFKSMLFFYIDADKFTKLSEKGKSCE